MSNETEEVLKNLHVKIPRELHARVRMMCIQKDMRIQDYVTQVLELQLGRDEKAQARK